MESDLLRKPVRVHYFPGYLHDVVRFDRVHQTSSEPAGVKSEDAGAGSEIDYHVARLYSKRKGLAVRARTDAIHHHLSVSGKAGKVHSVLPKLHWPIRVEACLNLLAPNLVRARDPNWLPNPANYPKSDA